MGNISISMVMAAVVQASLFRRDILRKIVLSGFRYWPGYKNPISTGRHRNDNISYLFRFFSQWICFWILVNMKMEKLVLLTTEVYIYNLEVAFP